MAAARRRRAASHGQGPRAAYPDGPMNFSVLNVRLVRDAGRCAMEHLGRPVPIVAIAAVLATAACSTTPTSPQAASQSQPASASSATVQTAQPKPAPSSPSSVEAGASSAVSGDILDEIALTRAAIQTRRQAIVTAAMDLTAPESQACWPLYREYRTEMAKVDDLRVSLHIV